VGRKDHTGERQDASEGDAKGHAPEGDADDAYGDAPEVPPGIIWLPESLSAQLLEDMYHDAMEELDDEEPKNFN